MEEASMDEFTKEGSEAADVSLGIEERKLEIEKGKLAIENRRLVLEQSKARWTAFSVVVPLIAVIGTVFFGLWSAQEQALSNFQLEAAKSIMQASSPDEAVNRVRFFSALFPEKIPANSFHPADALGIGIGGDEVSSKNEFIKLLAARGLNPKQTAELWRTLFDADAWAKDEKLIDVINGFDAQEFKPQSR
jgi:hypothetical protein